MNDRRNGINLGSLRPSPCVPGTEQEAPRVAGDGGLLQGDRLIRRKSCKCRGQLGSPPGAIRIGTAVSGGAGLGGSCSASPAAGQLATPAPAPAVRPAPPRGGKRARPGRRGAGSPRPLRQARRGRGGPGVPSPRTGGGRSGPPPPPRGTRRRFPPPPTGHGTRGAGWPFLHLRGPKFGAEPCKVPVAVEESGQLTTSRARPRWRTPPHTHNPRAQSLSPEWALQQKATARTRGRNKRAGSGPFQRTASPPGPPEPRSAFPPQTHLASASGSPGRPFLAQ